MNRFVSAQMARKLGIEANLLTRWKREADAAGQQTFGGTGTPRDEQVARLKRELAREKKERDFSREAATFFCPLSSGIQGWSRRKNESNMVNRLYCHLMIRVFWSAISTHWNLKSNWLPIQCITGRIIKW